jgi:two-component system KDP operon response regulator KdpE
MSHVLIIEDDPTMRAVIAVALRQRGYVVGEAGSAADARELLAVQRFDAVLLDLGLPDSDGVDLAAEIKRSFAGPILVVSARTEEEQLVRALDAGASDYVTKPFREGELMARLRAALRPFSSATAAQQILVGDLRIELLERRVFVGSREVTLTPTEFKLLHALGRDAGRVVRHEKLLGEVWGPNFLEDVHYLRVYMKQLRQKLEDDPARPTRLLTALGVGYRLTAPGESAGQ